MGWSLRETAGAVAVAVLRDGSSSGKIIGVANLASAGSNSEWFGPMGIRVDGDVYYEKVSGTIAGSVYIA